MHKERQQLWKRPIEPLNEEERDNHLFRTPLATLNLYQPLPAVGTMVDTFDSSDAISRVDAATSTQDLAQPVKPERELVYV